MLAVALQPRGAETCSENITEDIIGVTAKVAQARTPCGVPALANCRQNADIGNMLRMTDGANAEVRNIVLATPLLRTSPIITQLLMVNQYQAENNMAGCASATEGTSRPTFQAAPLCRGSS